VVPVRDRSRRRSLQRRPSLEDSTIASPGVPGRRSPLGRNSAGMCVCGALSLIGLSSNERRQMV